MTAKEMFEELDWEKHTLVTNGEVEIYFVKNNYCSRPITNEIDFKNKEIFITGNITTAELKAINKQIEELGWEDK